jgi:ABC-type multidrug transport system permease subunit
VLLDALSAVSSSFGAMWNTAEQRIVAGTHVLLDPLSALLGSFGAMWNMAEQRIVAGTHVLLDALSALSSWIDDRVEVFAPIILLVVLMSVLAVIILVLCCTVSTFRWERVVNNLHVETASWVGDDVASM